MSSRLPIRILLILPALLLMGFEGSAFATESKWQSVFPGMDVRRVERVSSGQELRLHLIRVDTGKFEFRALRPSSGKVDSVLNLVQSSGALAGINGSFFFENLDPMGLLISQGVKSHSLRRVDWGVFSLSKKGEAELVHTRDWTGENGVSFAIQTGPRLVVDGKPLTFRDSFARRSALCIVSPRTVVIVGTSNSVRMRDLAVVMSQPESAGGLGCVQALNLDGGSSTHMVMPKRSEVMGVHGFDRVPVGIGVFPR